MEHWDEIRTALFVAQEGTVSGAASALGVHHATVIRHVDALEERLGVKMFQRHSRGYTPTEAGQDLARVARAVEGQFAQLGGRLRGHGEEITGELVVTSLPHFSRRITPVLADFQRQHPQLIVRISTGVRLYKLEYGEAHVAIRTGPKPQEPDNVAQPFFNTQLGLYATQSYIDKHGFPRNQDFTGHRFVGLENRRSRAPFMKWLVEHMDEGMVGFWASDDRGFAEAIRAGAGMGFMEAGSADGLVEVMQPQPEWLVQSWLVTHVDLHRSAKVQATLACLKAAAKEWAKAEKGAELP